MVGSEHSEVSSTSCLCELDLSEVRVSVPSIQLWYTRMRLWGCNTRLFSLCCLSEIWSHTWSVSHSDSSWWLIVYSIGCNCQRRKKTRHSFSPWTFECWRVKVGGCRAWSRSKMAFNDRLNEHNCVRLAHIVRCHDDKAASRFGHNAIDGNATDNGKRRRRPLPLFHPFPLNLSTK